MFAVFPAYFDGHNPPRAKGGVHEDPKPRNWVATWFSATFQKRILQTRLWKTAHVFVKCKRSWFRNKLPKTTLSRFPSCSSSADVGGTRPEAVKLTAEKEVWLSAMVVCQPSRPAPKSACTKVYMMPVTQVRTGGCPGYACSDKNITGLDLTHFRVHSSVPEGDILVVYAEDVSFRFYLSLSIVFLEWTPSLVVTQGCVSKQDQRLPGGP